MKNSREILTSVLKTTQMGQIGIRSVLDTSMRPGLRKTLESQLREYDSIETEAIPSPLSGAGTWTSLTPPCGFGRIS